MIDTNLMIDSDSAIAASEPAVLVAAADECFKCAQTCGNAADLCLAVEESKLRFLIRCIRLNLDCADICQTTGRLLSRQGELDWSFLTPQLQACVVACSKCADENARHAKYHEFNKLTTDACCQCAQACQALLTAVPV